MAKKLSILITLALLAAACNQTPPNNTTTGSTDTVKSPVFRPANIKEQMIYQRAMEAANWGMSAVNFDLMVQATKKIGGDYNQITIWPGLLDWKNQTITPNPDVIYLMPFVNTTDVGPMVLEIPPADNGTVVGSVWTAGKWLLMMLALPDWIRAKAENTSSYPLVIRKKYLRATSPCGRGLIWVIHCLE